MNKILLIFFGCGCGGLLRYWIGTATHLLLGTKFPYGTLLVNVTGSLLMGFLFVVIYQTRFVHLSHNLGPLLLVGLLGGYTTFSSFSIETLRLIEMGELLLATMNVIGSVLLCILAAWVGTLIGRWV